MTGDQIKNQIELATKRIDGLRVLQLLTERYSVRFRLLDTSTGIHIYEVVKPAENHRYTIRLSFVKSLSRKVFMVRSRQCNCLRFAGEGDCHHCLLAIWFEAERCGFGEIFDLGKFAEYRLAKVYKQELIKRIAA